VEFDGLYRRVGFNELQENSVFAFVHTRTTANSREFPIVGKFRILHLPVLSSFIDGGVSFRRISGVSSSMVEVFDNGEPRRSTGSTSVTLDNRSSHGAVVGVGANIRAWLLHISREIRYTRWGRIGMSILCFTQNQNQVDLLLGVTF